MSNSTPPADGPSASEDRLIVDAGPIAHYVSTSSGALIACNRAFLELLGVGSTTELAGTDLAALKGSGHDVFRARLAAERRLDHYESVFHRPDGTFVRAIEHAVGRFDDRGVLQEIESFVVDEPSRERVSEQNERLHRLEALGLLAGGIAHDFNNLLTAIIGSATLALEDLPPDSPGRSEVEEILLYAEHGARLTRQIVSFARTRPTPSPEPADMAGVVGAFEPLVRRLAGEGIDLVCAVRPTGTVDIGRAQLEQILLNLAANAVDALGHGGTLRIETESAVVDGDRAARLRLEPGEYGVLRVTDSGVGMDAATRVRIFEPFFTTKESATAAGIGLATVRAIVRGAGGQIAVDSEPGRGARFEVYLRKAGRPLPGGPYQPNR